MSIQKLNTKFRTSNIKRVKCLTTIAYIYIGSIDYGEDFFEMLYVGEFFLEKVVGHSRGSGLLGNKYYFYGEEK